MGQHQKRQINANIRHFGGNLNPARTGLGFPFFMSAASKFEKYQFDIFPNLGYVLIDKHKRNKRDSVIGYGCLLNCPRTQGVCGFQAVFSKKSRRGQCTRGFVGFWGPNFAQKLPRAVRVCFWAFGATAPLGLKWGLLRSAFPFEGN